MEAGKRRSDVVARNHAILVAAAVDTVMGTVMGTVMETVMGTVLAGMITHVSNQDMVGLNTHVPRV